MLECPDCGEPRETCSDPAKVWHMRRTVCYKTIARAAAERIHEAEHEDEPWHAGDFTGWTKEQTPETPNRYDDGVRIWVAEEPGATGPPVQLDNSNTTS